MKKVLIAIALLVLTLIVSQIKALADQSGWPERGHRSSSYLNIYKIDGPIAVGLKERISGRFYAAANIQYRESVNDLQFQVGTAYFPPFKVLFFRLYGGPGLQFSRNQGFEYPYVMLGTNFLFFFSEALYPMKSHRTPEYRFGFSFRF